MKTFLATCSMVLLSAGAAYAQDDGTMGGDTSGGGGGTMGGGGDMNATTTTDPTMGIETELNGVGDVPAVHLLYNLGGNYLDAVVALSIQNVAPDGGDSITDFTIGIGAGYRMYKDMDGRIHPYLEPYLQFALQNDNEDPQMDPNIIDLGAGAMLGVDFQLFDQFTVGAALGGGLDFQIVGDPTKGNILSIGVYTTSVNATFWWG